MSLCEKSLYIILGIYWVRLYLKGPIVKSTRPRYLVLMQSSRLHQAVTFISNGLQRVLNSIKILKFNHWRRRQRRQKSFLFSQLDDKNRPNFAQNEVAPANSIIFISKVHCYLRYLPTTMSQQSEGHLQCDQIWRNFTALAQF